MKSSEYMKESFQPGDLVKVTGDFFDFKTLNHEPVFIEERILLFLGEGDLDLKSFYSLNQDYFIYKFLTKNYIVYDTWSTKCKFEDACRARTEYSKVK